MEAAQVLLMLGALGVAGGIAAYGWYRNQKRIEALHAFCLSKGWDFAPSDDSLAFRWTDDPFDEGTDRHATSVVRGSVSDRNFVAFDYRYVTQSTDSKGNTSRTTHRYAVCAVAIPTFLPEVRITPQSGHAFLGDDVELESEDFNRRYRVTAIDRKLACDVLSPRTMEMLLKRPTLHFRIAGTDVLCWEQGGTTPADLLVRTSRLAAFIAGIPAFVWRDHGVEPSSGGVAQ